LHPFVAPFSSGLSVDRERILTPYLVKCKLYY